MAESTLAKCAMLAGAPPLPPDYTAGEGKQPSPSLQSHSKALARRAPVRGSVGRVRRARNPPLSAQLCSELSAHRLRKLVAGPGGMQEHCR